MLIGDHPAASPRVSAHPLDEELVVYDAGSGRGYVLNATAAWVWAQCDGAHSAVAMAQDLAAAYPVAYERALADIRDILDDLSKAGLLSQA